jgi:polysaccharide pyruvyl transferase WcaK-like protein
LERFKRYSKPYIFLPQAFGPFTSHKSRERIRASFKHAAMICARDKISLEHIKGITGGLPNLVRFCDFTNITNGSLPKAFDSSHDLVCIVPNNNMLSSRNSNSAWLERYEIILVEAVKCYRILGLQPFFLNHEGRKDAALIDRVNQMLDVPIPVRWERDALAVKGIIGASRAVFCSRYHGCISALSQGIACVGTSWSHKYELLYQDYQASELLVAPMVTREELRAIIALSLDSESQTRKSIVEIAPVLKRDTESMWLAFHEAVRLSSPREG